jgi:hypothetical protein
MKIYTIGLFLFCSVFAAQAEFRIWEDLKGNVFEGEFITLAAGEVLIENQEGKEYRFLPEALCASDQQYLERRIPPKLGLDVTKNTNNSASKSGSEDVRCIATIKQTDRRPYTGELTAVLAVMGETIGSGSSMIVNRSEQVFTLPEIRGEAIEFASDRAQFYRKSRKTGKEYSGYVLVVYDRFGEVVAVKSNRASYEDRATKLASLGVKQSLKKVN